MTAWATNLKRSCFGRLQLHAAHVRSLGRFSHFLGSKVNLSPVRYYWNLWKRAHVSERRDRHRKMQVCQLCGLPIFSSGLSSGTFPIVQTAYEQKLQTVSEQLAASKQRIATLKRECAKYHEREEQAEHMYDEKQNELKDPTSVTNYCATAATVCIQALSICLDVMVCRCPGVLQ